MKEQSVVSLYFHGRKILISSRCHARSGGSMEVDPAYLVNIDSEDLGDKILLCAKAASEIDILPPAPKGYKQPVLKLPGAGVRSFKDLLRKFNYISVAVDKDNYYFHSFKSGGDRVGYVSDGQPVRSLQIAKADGDPRVVADLVRSMFLPVQ